MLLDVSAHTQLGGERVGLKSGCLCGESRLMGCGASAIAPAPAEFGDVVSLGALDREEAARVLGKSFAGTSTADPELTFDWCLGPTLADRNEPARAASLEWMFGYLLHSATGTHLLGVRSPSGELQAAALCWLSLGGTKGPGFKNYVCGGMRYAVTHKEVPAYMKNRKLIDKRMAAFDKQLATRHAKHAPGPHYYVSMLGVDPACQDDKIGSKLIRAVSQMADAKGVPCYLECSGTRVRDIYVHHGYEEKECSTVSIQGDEPGFAAYEELFAMVRPAKK